MPKSGQKPGKGVYQCTNCGQVIVLDNKKDTLPPCPTCHKATFKPYEESTLHAQELLEGVTDAN